MQFKSLIVSLLFASFIVASPVDVDADANGLVGRQILVEPRGYEYGNDDKYGKTKSEYRSLVGWWREKRERERLGSPPGSIVSLTFSSLPLSSLLFPSLLFSPPFQLSLRPSTSTRVSVWWLNFPSSGLTIPPVFFSISQVRPGKDQNHN